MTKEEREEAIKIIRKYECNAEHYEACEAIIKASEQELCEDAISRQAVCKIIDDIRDCISVDGYWAFLERLKKLPAVDPQNCDNCEVGNPCLYCRHEFELQERSDKE